MEEQTKCFSDMYFVAALMSYGPHSYRKVDKTDPKRQQFHFVDTIPEVYILSPMGPEKMLNPTLEELWVWYTAGILMYKANFVICINQVKSEVHT